MDYEIQIFTRKIKGLNRIKNHVFKRDNYFILNDVLYIIKISNSNKPFWGITKKIIDHIFYEYYDMKLILLTSDNSGFVFNKQEVIQNIKTGSWGYRSADDNYKINSPLPSINSFKSMDEFFSKFL